MTKNHLYIERKKHLRFTQSKPNICKTREIVTPMNFEQLFFIQKVGSVEKLKSRS